MLRLLSLLFGLFARIVRSRQSLLLENLALRQQLAVLVMKHPQSRLSATDRFFWVLLRRFWPDWKRTLLLVQPETVVGWHRAGFTLHWKWLSRPKVRAGRKPINKDLRDLIFRMVAENPTWGAPRIHGELKMLGFDISEPNSTELDEESPRTPEPAKRWAAFLSNHREVIATMDFFTVPTVTFGMLYCFFVISNDRRRILHCNVSRHPTSAWVSQQLREAFPDDSAPKCPAYWSLGLVSYGALPEDSNRNCGFSSIKCASRTRDDDESITFSQRPPEPSQIEIVQRKSAILDVLGPRLRTRQHA